MYENSIKSSSDELLGKPRLHDPLWKLFFEELSGDFMSLTMYIRLKFVMELCFWIAADRNGKSML